MTENKQFKKFSILSLVLMGLSLVYTLLLISFHRDISAFAFIPSILYLGITFYILVVEHIKNTNATHMVTLNRLVEFMPYVFFISFIMRRAGNQATSGFYDVITVILWIAIFVLSVIVSRKLDIRRCEEIVKDWKIPPAENKKTGIKKFIFEAGDWIYSIVWAIFSVLLIQIFVVQLYQIPSESMVPTFLVKDRVLVSKIDCGPKFPLTDVGLPTFRKYKRGDTVVLRNPHYSIDRKSEVKTVTSQLIYMLTFMTVNLNTDENGDMKADPLVKRIAGLPGEQLVMQDGVLYTRTKDSDEFVPSKTDEKYATWNLNLLKNKYGKGIINYLYTQKELDAMIELEAERNSYDLNLAAIEARQIVREVNQVANRRKNDGDFETPVLHENYLLSNVEDIAYSVLHQNGGTKWFSDFMTSWISSKDNNRDMYEESNYRLNVMTKLVFGKLIAIASKPYAGINIANTEYENQVLELYNKANKLNFYIQGLLDSRNMPVFPANDSNGNPQYLGDDQYFMMGDNRFNSLDLRHSMERTEKNLTKDDPMSVTYFSLMAPQSISKKYIIGKPIFTFWPPRRIGKV